MDAVINGTTYPAVESVALVDENGNVTQYYPDAVCYVEQALTAGQKEQARQNIGAVSKDGLSLGIHTDGLVYLFVDGVPVGTGIGMSVGGDVVGYVDENNNIVLTGALAEGTYTVKYEMEDGTVVDIGELSTVVEEEIVNLAVPNATNTNDWSLWCNNARIGSDGAYRSASGQIVTNWIEVEVGDTLYIKGLAFTADTHNACIYTTNKAKIAVGTMSYWYTNGYATFKTTNGVTTFKAVEHSHNTGMAYIRFGAALTGTLDDVVITKNQPIE